ncbi:hypothetical protein [Streptomyces sp. FIT100]|uniref:hypothetical protein n=1 Tax=Streptomyces sp. FIT100 TaxID=2837956 RepID=UPI0021C7CB43|nr:hypothetical protein [Streptomyces sp. FIT100]UUN27727.1 hypothetical protein KK483_15935 [Streptomyces sp. FIT100]
MSSDQQYPYDPYGQSYQPDPHVTQTWEGQTWDTQYQPTVQQGGPVQSPQQPPQPAAPYPTGAADTAYLPPVAASGPYPLPPETQAVPGAYGAQAPARAGAATAATASTAGPAYSAPTTLGNTRVTDAQRARANQAGAARSASLRGGGRETGGSSPIIPPGIQPAGLTAVLGLLLAAAGAAASPYVLLVPLVLLQAVTAAGWFRLNGMWPARQGIALAFAGGVAADVVLVAAGREHAPAAIIGTLGVWVLLTLVLQLRSRAGADERMQGLMATVASAALTILAAGYLAAEPDAVVVGGLAVAAATVARALPLPGAASVVVALLAAAGAGIAAAGFTGTGSGGGALLGLGAGVCALVGLRVASYDYPSRFVHMTAGVALPLTAAAPIVYLLGRALV